jgi:hypothetical protein
MKLFPDIFVAVLFASASPEHLDSVRHKGGLKALSAKLEEVHSKYFVRFILLHVLKKKKLSNYSAAFVAIALPLQTRYLQQGAEDRVNLPHKLYTQTDQAYQKWKDWYNQGSDDLEPGMDLFSKVDGQMY